MLKPATNDHARLTHFRMLGVSHEGAQVQSGLLAAVQGREIDEPVCDGKAAASGRQE